ncbi:MAG TPA: acyl-CoA dehydrogenase family protein [Actinophytocola sp.]|uniref:acyl-CoA dehydrogenase family protein n=1 Tax=Actinophytocola sp. TaxID=1872138 RepID=UPI002E0CAEC1|nr:acyl-CoA dehydrogenase family protein [Actinophytocola sp.]
MSISWTDRCGKGLTLNLYQLSDDYRAVREAVRDVCENVIAPTAATTDIVGEFPTAGYAALRDCEFHAPRIAEGYGGPGADALATAIIVEEVARACATCALIPAINSLCTQLLQDAASEEIKREYLPPVARGEAMMSFCLSEPEAGSDIRAMSTRAEPVAGGYRLNGTKRWITHAGISAFYLVFAVNSHRDGSPGISGFIVEKDDPGLSFGRLERKMGIKGSPTREVYLEDVRIPASRLIGEPGSGLRIALNALDHGRVTIAAQAVGIAQGALEYATDYARQRRQFGKPIGAMQSVQFMLADMAMKVEAARHLTYAAAARSQQADADLAFYASAAKCFASDTAISVATDAVQVLGANGYSCEYPVERMMRDAKVTQIYGGTNQIQRLVIARSLPGAHHG